MKTTFEQLWMFNVCAGAYLKTETEETKLAYAIKKVAKQVEAVFEDYNEALEDIKIDHCATDENGVILKDEKGGFEFTKDGLKSKRKAEKSLVAKWNEKEFEIETYFATELPEDLDENILKGLESFVIEPIEELVAL